MMCVTVRGVWRQASREQRQEKANDAWQFWTKAGRNNNRGSNTEKYRLKVFNPEGRQIGGSGKEPNGKISMKVFAED